MLRKVEKYRMDIRLAKQQRLDALYAPYRNCKECPLGRLGRTHVVFGEGNPDAALFLTGEAPGKQEDLLGKPFIGQSGRLLDQALEQAGIIRSETFIGSIVKCRPPENRTPRPLEIAICTKLFLFRQIEIIEPRIICVLGSVALNVFTKEKVSISKVRGTLLSYKDTSVVFPTFHPAYLLRNRSQLQTWFDDFNYLADLLTLYGK